jgi:uncharacterized LabA/DUF88 family protein
MDTKNRVIIFIDGSNHYHILKKLFRNSKKLTNFNFEKFVNLLLKPNQKLIRIYYYTAPLDRLKDEETYIKQQKFFEKLRKIPNFKLILCRMQKQKINGEICYIVKEDDIHLAVDMVRLAYNDAYDSAILVSSDGDFIPAIQAVKEKGKNVINIGFQNKFSFYLKQECDEFRKLGKEELELCFD